MNKWHVKDMQASYMLGLLPEIIEHYDPSPVKDQIAVKYAHGGGWRPFAGFNAKIDQAQPLNSRLIYRGDLPMKALAWTRIRDELVIMYEHAWVSVTGEVAKPGGIADTVVIRMD